MGLVPTGRGAIITVRMATSYVSEEQARLNLRREVGDKSYDALKAHAHLLFVPVPLLPVPAHVP